MSGNEDNMWKLLEDYNIPVLPTATAASPDEAVEMAQQMGFPVVLKVLSPDISHKSDVGGVILNIDSDNDVRDAYSKIVDTVGKKAQEARIKGVIVQKMAESGLEVIVGVKFDHQFGHVIMFGLGGIFVEIFKDVSFRVTPVDEQMARDMINEVRGSVILKGVRGQKAGDIDAIVNVITGVSRMLEENTDIAELDINPLIVYPHGIVAADARMRKMEEVF